MYLHQWGQNLMNFILEFLKLLISSYFLYQSGNFLLVHPVYNLIELLCSAAKMILICTLSNNKTLHYEKCLTFLLSPDILLVQCTVDITYVEVGLN